MPSIVDQITNALARALAAPGLLASFVGSNVGTGAGISPWALWLLFGLIRHEQRQQWVGQIAVNLLGADLTAISELGALEHPENHISGLVPGHTDWEYFFHGVGLRLTNRISGEVIDVDFYDGSAEWFNGYFYLEFLGSLKQPTFIEQRIITLHATPETALLSVDELLDLGLLERHAKSRAFRLIPACRDWADQLEMLDDKCRHPEEIAGVGRALRDWLLIQEQSQASDLIKLRAQACVDLRVHRLKGLYAQAETRQLALRALADLGAPDARVLLEAALREPPSGTASVALKIVQSLTNEDWTEAVFRVLQRMNPNGEIPEPSILLDSAQYLLSKRVHVDAVRQKLSAMSHRELGDAAVLALECLPDLAVDLFRRALRSRVPADRTTAAAALAILDQPWSRAELLAVLRESTDQEATGECRAALSALPHADLRQIVDHWETINPHEAETGPFISIREMSLRTRASWLQHAMETLHDRVLPLRSRRVEPTRADTDLEIT
jgi:hypothetical protein